MIKIKKLDNGKMITVHSPYHPDFAFHARNLGGKWNGNIWTFDIREEDSIRDLCLDLFGTDGKTPAKLVDVIVKNIPSRAQSVWFCGKEIAKRPYRDSHVRLDDGVILKSGSFPRSGGSRSCPYLDGDDVVLEVRNVSLLLALREKEKDPDNIIILDYHYNGLENNYNGLENNSMESRPENKPETLTITVSINWSDEVAFSEFVRKIDGKILEIQNSIDGSPANSGE